MCGAKELSIHLPNEVWGLVSFIIWWSILGDDPALNLKLFGLFAGAGSLLGCRLSAAAPIWENTVEGQHWQNK